MSSDPQSDVMIIKASKYAVLLLVKKPSPREYHLFTINTLNGSFSYDGIEGKSFFSKKNEAFQYIKRHYDFTPDDVILGKGLIGAARFGKYLYILTIQKYVEVARIQNKHSVYLIKKVNYFTIELPFFPPLTAKEQRRIERIIQFPIKNYHIWCPTADLTTPIFSKSHDDSFVWNKYWQEPFESFGLSELCIDMLQGTAISKVLQFNESISTNDLDYYRFTLITLREASNGGMRYYSRGLDDENHAGNEVQSELIVETNSGKFWSHVWRRGSIPVEWKSILAKNFPTVSVSISPQPGKNTHAYFDRLHETFPNAILCVNLLHNAPDNSEYPLCAAYRDSVKDLPRVQYLEFDWHSEVKSKGLSDAVKAFYDSLQIEGAEESDDKFNIELTYTKTDEDLYVPPQEATPDVFETGQDPSPENTVASNFHFKNELDLPLLGAPEDGYITKQTKIARLNCMDSLDRTNVGCFFYAAKVISKIMIEAGVVLRSSKQRSDEIEDYLDLMNGIPLSIRRFLCEAFIKIGDVVAFLYTNTPACMTETFFEVAEVNPKNKEMRENVSASKPQNDSSIAVKRRYHNFLTDKNRQKMFNMFRGKAFEDLIPNVDCGHVPSSLSLPPNAQFMPPYGSIVDKTNLNTKNSSDKSKSRSGKNAKKKKVDVNNLPQKSNYDLTALLQCAPFSVTAFNSNTILIILSRYSYVRDVCIVLVPSEYAPTAVRISFSLTFGPKLPLLPRTALPRVDKPTPVMIKIPPDFANHTGNLPQRFLWFEFASVSGSKISLSNIFVFGEPYRKKVDNFYKFTYQNIVPDIKLPEPSEIHANDQLPNKDDNANETPNTNKTPDTNANQNANESANEHKEETKSFDYKEDIEELKKKTPEEFLKELPDKTIDFDNFVKYEIIRIANRIGRLESIAIAAINGFNPLDFSLDILKKRIVNTNSETTSTPSKPQNDEDQSNESNNSKAMFAVEWDDVCAVCERKASWKCFECGKAYCDGSESKCSDVHYIDRSNFYAAPILLCDGCYHKYIEHERLLKALIQEYDNFYSYLSTDEVTTSRYVENWLNTFSPCTKSEVSFNLDPTYFPSAFFQNPLEPQFNNVLTETGKVEICSTKKTQEQQGGSILENTQANNADEKGKPISSIYNLDSINDAYMMYQGEELFLFLGKPIRVDLIQARGSDDLNMEIYSHNGMKKLHLNKTFSIPREKIPLKRDVEVKKDDESDESDEQITYSDVQKLNESLESDDYDSTDKQNVFRSDEICQGLIIVSDSDCPSDSEESSFYPDYSSDDNNEPPSSNEVDNNDEIKSYNESFRQSLIISSEAAENALALSTTTTPKEDRSFYIPTDFEDRFLTLRIKDGSLSYFHVDGLNTSDPIYERDNDNSPKDYDLYPNKKIKIIKSAKSTPLSSISSKKSSSSSNSSTTTFFVNNPNIDSSNPNSTAHLLKRMTLSADCGKETKIRGVLLQNCQGAHSILIYLYYSSSEVKVISYYLPLYEGNEFAIRFSNVQRVVKVYVQFIDVSPFFKDPKFSLYI